MNRWKWIKFFGDVNYQENYWDWGFEEKLKEFNESQYEENTL